MTENCIKNVEKWYAISTRILSQSCEPLTLLAAETHNFSWKLSLYVILLMTCSQLTQKLLRNSVSQKFG